MRSKVNFYRLVGSILAEGLSKAHAGMVRNANIQQLGRYNKRHGLPPSETKPSSYDDRQSHHMQSHNKNDRGRYEANQAKRTNREIAAYLDAEADFEDRTNPINFRPKADRPVVASEREQQRRVASKLRTNADEMEGLEKEFTDARDVDANKSRPHPLRSVPKRKKK